jgi:hypothetical protein
MRFTLEDFHHILETTNLEQLTDSTIEVINMLASHVGAPEYIKTPQFKPKAMQNPGNSIRRKKKFQDVNDDDWETIRTFQTTEFQKKEGLEVNIHRIRKLLNMLTEKTYDKLAGAIITEVQSVISTKTENDVYVLCEQIYDIVAGNILYSNIYAKLYQDLITNVSIFKDVLLKRIDAIDERINSIEYVDPDVNYDKFCENNKKNEKLRATGAFYANLMKKKVIEVKTIYEIILTLFSSINKFIQGNTNKNELDELSELVYIVVLHSYDNIKAWSPDNASLIREKIEKLALSKVKSTPGITNKCIFKHMDLLDELNN